MTRRGLPALLAALIAPVALVAASGCSGDPDIRSYRVPKTPETAPAAAAEDEHAHAGDGHLAWDTPEGWIESPGGSMRLATFAVPLSGEGAGDCSIVVLSGVLPLLSLRKKSHEPLSIEWRKSSGKPRRSPMAMSVSSNIRKLKKRTGGHHVY